MNHSSPRACERTSDQSLHAPSLLFEHEVPPMLLGSLFFRPKGATNARCMCISNKIRLPITWNHSHEPIMFLNDQVNQECYWCSITTTEELKHLSIPEIITRSRSISMCSELYVTHNIRTEFFCPCHANSLFIIRAISTVHLMRYRAIYNSA